MKFPVTQNGFLLEEIVSLLRKSLRRKEVPLARQATREIMLKCQLQWSVIFTALFEDHCLVGSEMLDFFAKKFRRGGQQNQFECIEMLLTSCRTCRIAPRMAQHFANKSTPEKLTADRDGSVLGLVKPREGCIDCDELLGQMLFAWKTKNWDQVGAYAAVAASVIQVEGYVREVTPKGKNYLAMSKPGRRVVHPQFYHVLFVMLYKNTPAEEEEEKTYLRACCDIAVQVADNRSVKKRMLVLMLYSALARCVYRDAAPPLAIPITPRGKWRDFADIEEIPDWAIDIETYRGRTGLEVSNMFSARPKKFMEDYVEESLLCKGKAVVVGNHFKEETAVETYKDGRPAITFTNQYDYRNMLSEGFPNLVSGNRALDTNYVVLKHRINKNNNKKRKRRH